MNPDGLPWPVRSEWPARLAPSTLARTLPASSARRSFSIDVATVGLRVRLLAAGRDVVVTAAGCVKVIDEVTLEVLYADDESLTVESLTIGPPERHGRVHAALQAMCGGGGRHGFRARADLILDHVDAGGGSLLHSMLYDAPIAVAVRRAADPPDEPFESVVPHRTPVDLCAGYRQGGNLAEWTSRHGPRRLGVGPRAEPIATHAVPPVFPELGRAHPGALCRRRRIDVCVTDGDVAFESMFRDSVLERTGTVGEETVVHEYVVVGCLDHDRSTISACAAHPIVLPAPDCPAAAASAARLIGRHVDDVQREVRESFRGTSTCTHLNDALWMVGVVGNLVRQVELDADADR